MIVVFSMGTINYYVDSYAQLRTTYLDVAEKMAEGYHVTGLSESRYNERYLALAAIHAMETVPECAVLGTSRSMTYQKEDFHVESLYNFSLSGGYLYDYYSIIGYLTDQGKLPKKVILEVGGPLFYEEAIDPSYTYLQGGIDYLNAVIEGHKAKCQYPAVGRQYQKFLSIDYFKYNLECLLKGERFQVTFTDEVENTQTTKLSDGSFITSKEIRDLSVDYVEHLTRDIISSKSLYKVEGYEELSDQRIGEFEKLVTWLIDQGVEVSLFLPPYSDPIYSFMKDNQQDYAGVFASEEYVVAFAKEYGLKLYGSYDPAGCDLQLEDLEDAYHIRKESAAKALYLR
ncbi:MAG: hypothetical protein E7293_11505 [Lachnospiraceae bacterium]|nr:hypothetical protein [Lachnospiraceae bacterium]